MTKVNGNQTKLGNGFCTNRVTSSELLTVKQTITKK